MYFGLGKGTVVKVLKSGYELLAMGSMDAPFKLLNKPLHSYQHVMAYRTEATCLTLDFWPGGKGMEKDSGLSGLVVRVSALKLGGWGSIPGRVIPKTRDAPIPFFRVQVRVRVLHF